MSLIVYDGVPPNLAHPYRVTAVAADRPRVGRALAELMLRLLGDGVREQRLEAPVIEAGDTDGPLRG